MADSVLRHHMFYAFFDARNLMGKNVKKTQSIFEYFILFGVMAAIVVIGSAAFKKKIRDSLVQYRDHQGMRLIKANGSI